MTYFEYIIQIFKNSFHNFAKYEYIITMVVNFEDDEVLQKHFP